MATITFTRLSSGQVKIQLPGNTRIVPGDGWSLDDSGTKIIFSRSGDKGFEIETSGNTIVENGNTQAGSALAIAEVLATTTFFKSDEINFSSSYFSGTGSAASPIVLKPIAPRVQAVTSSATVTPDADNNDAVKITAQAAALTLANPSGTPSPMQAIVIRIKDNGTSRSISYGAQYRAVGVTLPTATTINKTTYLGLIYNSDDSKWDCIGVSAES